MNKAVEKALKASIKKFAEIEKIDSQNFLNQILEVFNWEGNFLEKTDKFDAVFETNEGFEELKEVYFDLMMINFFTADAAKLEADYLDSEEWADIEEQTLDRGTEFLNLLLYVNECKDEHIQPSLDDFLKEFLLVDEDEFQDEFHIYEDLISNQALAESSIEDICNNAGLMNLNEEMEELFVPFMCFFNQPNIDEKSIEELEKFSNNASFDVALYTLIVNFNKI